MGQEGSTSSTQNPRLILVTALITALTTLGVSFIGILPQLRRGDKEEVQPVGSTGTKTLIIRGTVRSDDGARLLTGYDVYLLAASDNFVTTTDDAGKFTFQGVPDSSYFIVIRDSSNGKSGRGFLDGPVGEVQMIGAKVKYRIQDSTERAQDTGERQ